MASPAPRGTAAAPSSSTAPAAAPPIRMLNAAPSPASGRGVVYRSLALPGQLSAGPLAIDASSSPSPSPLAVPTLVKPVATERGEVLWDAKRPSEATPSTKRKHLPPTLLAVPPATTTYAAAPSDVPATSFALRSASLDAVESSVSSCLTRREVDFSYDSAKYAWRVAAYDATSGAVMRARVSLLRIPEKSDVYVLDFDRYCGCPGRFADLILDAYADLHAANVAVRCSQMVQLIEARAAAAADPVAQLQQQRRRNGGLRPPPALPADCACAPDSSSSSSSPADDGFASLRAACASTLIDVQLEALRCACSLLDSRPDARAELASYGVSDELAAVARATRCAEARRLAVTALAALACDDVARVVVAQMGSVEALVACLAGVAADADEQREARRQAARGLDALTSVSEGAKRAMGELAELAAAR